MAERATTTIRLRRLDGSWEIAFGTEALIIPAPVAEALARHILGQPAGPPSGAAQAALAVAATP